MAVEKKITWLQRPDTKRLDSVWYGGKMVEIDTPKYVFSVEALGEVRVDIDGETFVDKNETGRVGDELRSVGIDTDEKLNKAVDKGRIYFGNNNWYELFVFSKEENEYLNSYEPIDLEPYDDFEWLDAVIMDLEA